ncbi:PstS family phosphate ABC transporter substrate-binding protein [Crocinitomicaceae bacterium CZZ-1]|uniref:PstS family phosphate ABC transporter substrate-binding protein n=1 Tax=Taishania pollutisoli TaxID=2766479 RepID=A0A8J6TTF7_9FLAO|nr:PstS family phosphate ABC transporter substrate-binding protein [Taishania pollutisoli]MBC9813042.1 PstS family phosphate ABC transporter substrate-binding protein [Taishania pollutisoli]
MKHIIGILTISLLLTTCQKATEQTDSYTIKGSDSELELIRILANNFEEEHPMTRLSISGGGSAYGVQELIKGAVDAANSSRMITREELTQAQEKGINPVPIIIATDAVAIITNPKLKMDSLSIFQVRDILSGTITNWKEIGGPDQVITVYGRDYSSGTREFLKKTVLKSNFAANSKELKTSKEIIESVKKDIGGIGYVSVGTLMDENHKPNGEVWATYLYLENNRAVSPYEFKSVESGDYPLKRPLFQYFNGWPKGDLLQYVEFELSEKGQAIIRENGYFPITHFHEHLNEMSKKEALEKK